MTVIEHPERTLVIERVFDAPRELVYSAWIDGANIDKWWGPSMMTTKTVERNFEVGGAWKYEMFMPDGSSMGKIVENHYLEIHPNEKIVWNEQLGGDDSSRVNITLLFEDAGEETAKLVRQERTQRTPADPRRDIPDTEKQP